MVPGNNPVIELEKLPVPVPSDVLVFEAVGPDKVFQQTPLAVTAAPPSDVILPPLVADAELTAEITVVEITGKIAGVVTVNSLP